MQSETKRRLSFASVSAVVAAVATMGPAHAAWFSYADSTAAATRSFSDADWKASVSAPAQADASGQKVVTAPQGGLVLNSANPITGPQVLRARVRLKTDSANQVSAFFRIGCASATDLGYTIQLVANKANDNIVVLVADGAKPLHDTQAITGKLNWFTPLVNQFNYELRSFTQISPGWPQAFRANVENDMAGLPDHNAKWVDVRVELRTGQVRFWLDDRLLTEKNDASIKAEGLGRIQLDAGMQLASYGIAPLEAESKGYFPIALGGYANAHAFQGNATVEAASLPAPDKTVKVGSVPFVFSGVNTEGNDHLDIGRSLYCHANMEGYFPTYEQSWRGSLSRDPARIQLRVPFRQYDALYLVAASDSDKESVPLITAMFYRARSGFSENFEARVPLATAQSIETRPLPVRLNNGSSAKLWLVKIPLDTARLRAFSDMDTVEIELTKKVYQYRAYPDPVLYGWHQGGLPSAVHVYAATLGESTVGFQWTPDKFGHVWTAPEVPGYTAAITNRSNKAANGTLTITTKSYDGTETTSIVKNVQADAGETEQVKVAVPVKLNGYHDLTATLKMAGKTRTEHWSFVRLAPDTRAKRWTEGQGALFGYWSYHGGHYSPKVNPTINLMTLAGARTSSTAVPPLDNELAKEHWSPVMNSGVSWATGLNIPWTKDPSDPEVIAAYKKTVVDLATKYRENTPEIYRSNLFPVFPEPSFGPLFTDGNYPEYWGEPASEMDETAKTRYKYYYPFAKAASEAFREKWPDAKVLIAWGDPLFSVPLLRGGFPKELIDGSGLDACGFERLPEQQLHQVSTHRLYTLRKEYEKAGIKDPLLAYTEGIFVPTEIGACSWREQMDIYNRWTLISMAYGVKRFYSGWFAFDLADDYGAEHYGACGIQRRIPFCDPKPAYAAYATMTDKLDRANFAGWLPTGSLSTYCLRFKGPKGNVYTLWTIRGRRPVTLKLDGSAKVTVTDTMNNSRTIQSRDNKITLGTDASVIYVTGGEIKSVSVGQADNSDARPAPGAKQVADLGDGSWRDTAKRDVTYETNNFDTYRYVGQFQNAVVTDNQKGSVLKSTLGAQRKVHELMPWYDTLVPARPVTLPGAPSKIGLWVKGVSDWGRVVYTLSDAKGETWISVGSKDNWNCDDMHSWSSFNFDGWRYVTFELPGHTGYDSYRKYGTTWWRSIGGDNIVDLPLKLENIHVEQRSHILYVNDVQPVASSSVSFGKMYAEYESPEDATEEAVRISKIRQQLPADTANLPNPIKDMAQSGSGDAPAITKLDPPTSQNDGTTVRVYFDDSAAAKGYYIWCSPHADGRAAVNMTPAGAKSGALITGLRAGMEFHFWVVKQDANSQMSKPSAAASITLVDMFKER